MPTHNQSAFPKPYLKSQESQEHTINKSLLKTHHLVRKNLGGSLNSRLMGSHSKNMTHNLRDSSIENTRFMPNCSLKLKTVGQFPDENTSRKQKYEQIKTQRKQARKEKSEERKELKKMYNDDSADYYKYWKKKAADYQQLNFTLNRLNSAVQEENQILKNQIERMHKKLARLQQPLPKPSIQTQNYEKLENYYRARMEQLHAKIEEQQMLISKHQKKIGELSNYISENYQPKNLLDSMEDRKRSIKSLASRDRSFQQIPDTSQRSNKDPQFLAVQNIGQAKQNPATNNSIRDKKNGVINFTSTNAKPVSSKWL